MERILVHPRVVKRHPELSVQQVRYAWEHALRSAPRVYKDPHQHLAIGVDASGKQIESVAKILPDGSVLIYHAFSPPTRKALHELGLTKRG